YVWNGVRLWEGCRGKWVRFGRYRKVCKEERKEGLLGRRKGNVVNRLRRVYLGIGDDMGV
ncbi:hypothetical protein, partial [Bacillus sp. WP8]|uniref:hypothetical protein n=1 Tax=Bacillus sp. WP8 TaxID=756828 RepID=UPI0037BFE9D5